MADDLSLLFRLKAQNQASPVINTVQSDVAKLTKSAGSDFNALSQVSTAALSKITSSLTNMAGSVPIVGNAVSGLSSELTGLATATEGAGAEFAAIAGPIGIAVVATGAMVAAVAALGSELFDLAKIAGETQGKLFDLSQQTGVSVETLSALQELAKTTGGSIESLAQSLVVFQGNLESAQDPTSKQAELFKALGVETNNTEEALRQSLSAIAKMTEGFQQTNAAAELFGRRGGKQFLAILKESHGDIDKTIRELQGLGLANSENAKRADEFNDQLIKVQTALTSLSVTIGNQVIPQVLDALKELEKGIKDNREAIESLSVVVKTITFLFVTPFKGALVAISAPLKVHQLLVEGVTQQYKNWAAIIDEITGKIPNIPQVQIPTSIPGSTDESLKDLQRLIQIGASSDAARKAAADAQRKFDLEKIFGDPKKAKESIDPAIQLLKQLQGELLRVNDATKEQTISAELLDKKYKNISASVREQILLTARLIDQRKEAADAEEKLQEEEEKAQRQREEAAESITRFMRAQAEELDRLRGVTRLATTDADEFIRSISSIPGVLSDSDEKWIKWRALLINAEEALKGLNEQVEKFIENAPKIVFPEPTQSEIDKINPDAPAVPKLKTEVKDLQTALDALGESFGKVFGASEEFGKQFSDLAGGAIADMAFAIGDLVDQWVLLGDAGPNAMRKLTASVLAGLAAQAATKAVFQLAEGFAALFFNPAEAAAHFTSAALFAGIATGAAAAGRSVAGDLFKQKPGTGSQTQGSGALNTTIVSGRNQPEPLHVTVVVKPDGSRFGDAVTAHVVENIGRGGEIREVIATDGRAR